MVREADLLVERGTSGDGEWVHCCDVHRGVVQRLGGRGLLVSDLGV